MKALFPFAYKFYTGLVPDVRPEVRPEVGPEVEPEGVRTVPVRILETFQKISSSEQLYLKQSAT